MNHRGKQINHSLILYMKKQRRGLNRYNVLCDSWSTLDWTGVELNVFVHTILMLINTLQLNSLFVFVLFCCCYFLMLHNKTIVDY